MQIVMDYLLKFALRSESSYMTSSYMTLTSTDWLSAKQLSNFASIYYIFSNNSMYNLIILWHFKVKMMMMDQ